MNRFVLLLALLAASLGAATRPNVVVVLIDDMGWKDVGFAGNRFIETPNLDRFAQEGTRFTSVTPAPLIAPPAGLAC